MDNITRYYGVYRGVVKGTSDPLNQRRVKLVVPQTTGNQVTSWAWPLEPAHTHLEVPPVGQGVWVIYQGGDPDYPLWMGSFGNAVYKGKLPYLKALSDLEDISDVTDLLAIINNSGTNDYDVTQTILNTVRNRYYGSYLNTTAQVAPAADTSVKVLFDTTLEQNGISRSSGTFTFEHSGVYSITFSMQLTNESNQDHDAKVWIKVNGSDVPQSASVVTVPGTHGGIKGHNVFTVNYVQTFDEGDTLELWGGTNNVAVKLESLTASQVVNIGPAVPAVILTIAKVR